MFFGGGSRFRPGPGHLARAAANKFLRGRGSTQSGVATEGFGG